MSHVVAVTFASLSAGLLLAWQAQLAQPAQSAVQPSQPGPTAAAAAEQLAQAESRYRAALAIDPSMGAYHESLALVLERQGRLREALASHREAVRLDSMAARSRAGYGSLLLRLDSIPQAIEHLEAAARLDPQSADIRRQLAVALAKSGEPGDIPAGETAGATTAGEAPAALADPALGVPADDQTATPVEGYHDLSGFPDDAELGWTIRRGLEWLFAAVLGLSALALLGPLFGLLLVLLRELPAHLRRRSAAAQAHA